MHITQLITEATINLLYHTTRASLHPHWFSSDEEEEEGHLDEAAELREGATVRGRLPNSWTETFSLGAGLAAFSGESNVGFSVDYYDTSYGIPGLPGVGKKKVTPPASPAATGPGPAALSAAPLAEIADTARSFAAVAFCSVASAAALICVTIGSSAPSSANDFVLNAVGVSVGSGAAGRLEIVGGLTMSVM